jgi:hypothetical protein
MSARIITAVAFALITLGSTAELAAELIAGTINSIARDVKRRQCWPNPFVGPDRAAVRAPFVTQVANGWRRQNMLGEYHFEPATGQLTEAGQRKVHWILQSAPKQHRLVYVHTAGTDEETRARVAAVELLMRQMAPNDLAPVMTTSISDDGWPADQVDLIGRKFQATTPIPRLPTGSSGSSSGGNGSGN